MILLSKYPFQSAFETEEESLVMRMNVWPLYPIYMPLQPASDVRSRASAVI